MTSFQTTLSPSRRKAARFISAVRRALQKALAEEQRKRGITQSEIARALSVHRSVINRELRGEKDLTLGRIAEIAYVLGRKPSFSLIEIAERDGANEVAAYPQIVTSTTTAGDGFTGSVPLIRIEAA